MQFTKYVAAIATLGLIMPVAAFADTASSTIAVTIDKFVDGSMATASMTNNASFPFTATWQAQNISGGSPGSGSFSLSTSGLNSANPYEAVTSQMTSGASYALSEQVPTTCDPATNNGYALVGYTTGDTFAAAASGTPSTSAPNLTNITTNKYIIAWNRSCLTAPTLVSPVNGSSETSAQFTSANWNAVSNRNTPTSYVYQLSNSSATTSDGTFVTPLYTSGLLSTTTVATAGTAAGTYYWHVQAQDAKGNKSPWSATFQTTVTSSSSTTPPGASTVKVHIAKYLDGAMATASSANNYLFPMSSTWTASNLNGGATASGRYTLGNYYGNAAGQYGADTSAMNSGANYSTYEITNNIDSSSRVLPVGAACASGNYQLQGYSTSSVSFADAAVQPVSTSVPTFTNLSGDQYVIVRNSTCGGGTTTPPGNGLGTISGKVLQDNMSFFIRNFNMGSRGLSGWTVYLDTNNNGVLDSGEPSTTTNGNGKYTFTNVAAGTYTVREVAPAGWILVSPSSGAYTITLASGQVVANKNFDNIRNSTISGNIFNDRNGNGRRNGNEEGLSGWTVTLSGFNGFGIGATSTSVTTDSNGNYSFSNVAPGFYWVTETTQSGWNLTSNSPAFIFVQPSQNVSNINFGNLQPGSNNGNYWSSGGSGWFVQWSGFGNQNNQDNQNNNQDQNDY